MPENARAVSGGAENAQLIAAEADLAFFFVCGLLLGLAEGKQLVLAAGEPNIWRVTAGYGVKPKHSTQAGGR